MIMYPSEFTGTVNTASISYTIGNADHNTATILATPRQVKDILKNPLNDVITYQRRTFTTVQIKLKNTSPWLTPIVRIYTFHNQSFDWAIANIHTDISSPNLQCLSCGAYDYAIQYSGREMLNIVCENCINAGYTQEFSVNFTDELHDNFRKEKVNWAKEGF